MGWTHHKTFALGHGFIGAQGNARGGHPAPERHPPPAAWPPSQRVFANVRLAADPSPNDAAAAATTVPLPAALVGVPGAAEKSRLGLEKKQVCGLRYVQSYLHPQQGDSRYIEPEPSRPAPALAPAAG